MKPVSGISVFSLMDTETNLIVHTETLKRFQVLHLHVSSVFMIFTVDREIFVQNFSLAPFADKN